MLLRCAEERPVHGGPTVVQVDVVLPGHSYSPGDLDTIVNDVGNVFTHIRLGDTCKGPRRLVVVVQGIGQCVHDRLGTFE